MMLISYIAEMVSSILNTNLRFLQQMTAVTDKYLAQSGRRWVDLTGLFGFMKVSTLR